MHLIGIHLKELHCLKGIFHAVFLDNIRIWFAFPRVASSETKILNDDEIARNRGRFFAPKRVEGEEMIGYYHPVLFPILRCNMDLQPVTNAMAIAYYIAKYMSKAEPLEIRQDVKAPISKIHSSNLPAAQKMFRVTMTIMRHREVGAQEAAFRNCHLFLRSLHGSATVLGTNLGFIKTYQKLNARKLAEFRRIYSNVKWIFIDEISMVSYENFRAIHLRLCEIFNTEGVDAFANKNVVIWGDLLQLPPPKAARIFMQPSAFSAEVNLWRQFQFSELTINMRQGTDPLSKICSELRVGNLSEDSLRLLQDRLNFDQTEFENAAQDTNIDVMSGKSNGTTGVVRKIEWTIDKDRQISEGDMPKRVSILFDHESVETWIEPTTVEFFARGQERVTRRTLPLILCWAITTHKTQGSTLNQAVVYLGSKCKTKGLAYVAISRVRTLAGLGIITLDPRKLLTTGKFNPADTDALDELERLRAILEN
ncbi:ATP-dependent DNA helicase PIF1 [Folsomia candida]|uniref:ATP-dependent DNA helicase n=1 Tax=Folsomia candida TaxID=158441 RepID=A0A226EH49_FOLCA|nr:ATP-dependent DNA helicase PIF1 [Folsomia candida]